MGGKKPRMNPAARQFVKSLALQGAFKTIVRHHTMAAPKGPGARLFHDSPFAVRRRRCDARTIVPGVSQRRLRGERQCALAGAGVALSCDSGGRGTSKKYSTNIRGHERIKNK